jgi:hypothetical protein
VDIEAYLTALLTALLTHLPAHSVCRVTESLPGVWQQATLTRSRRAGAAARRVAQAAAPNAIPSTAPAASAGSQAGARRGYFSWNRDCAMAKRSLSSAAATRLAKRRSISPGLHGPFI